MEYIIRSSFLWTENGISFLIEIEKPESMDDAFEIAELLAKEFPFVRVDLYIVRNRIYFGELTFTPAAGMDTDFKFRAPGAIKDTDTILGELLKLPE